MAHVFAGVFPVQSGKEDRVRNLEKELAEHREEWDRLSTEGTFTRYNAFLQPTPEGGFVAMYAFEVEDPTKIRMSFTDSPHDRWWVSYFHDVHGINLDEVPDDMKGPPSETVLSWSR